MSSQTQSNFLTLPPELIENIAKQVDDKRDLAGMRMACKMFDKPAANEMFKFVYLSPAQDVVDAWNSISEHESIRRIPRHAVIHTKSDIEERDGFSDEEEPDEIGKDFKSALAALSKYPNLDSIAIGFTPECKGRDIEAWEKEPTESIYQRVYLLKLIFKAIESRAANLENRTIRKLTIKNLQNCPIPDFTSSELFRAVMSQLEELHIALVHEHNEDGPDYDYTKIELQTFPAHFIGDWLKPISKNLKALSIHHRNENWGPFPGYFDFNGIDFSKLETLNLGYYTLAHDSDLDWIVGIKSLRKLVLFNCMITSYIRILEENMITWKPLQHDWISMNGEHDEYDDSLFQYEGRWSTCLDRIADGLPNLIDVRFDQGTIFYEKPYDVEEWDDCEARIFPKRYVVFDNAIMPTHWPETASNGELYKWVDEGEGFPNLHEQRMEEDQKSLDKLLKRTRSRR